VLGVEDIWHPKSFDCLKLIRVKQITATTEVTCSSQGLFNSSKPTATVIAKIARFQWEISRISQETRIYKSLENTPIGPRFLGHVHEHGRVIGILLEKLEDREAAIENLSACMSSQAPP
jgi:hypothetical protein